MLVEELGERWCREVGLEWVHGALDTVRWTRGALGMVRHVPGHASIGGQAEGLRCAAAPTRNRPGRTGFRVGAVACRTCPPRRRQIGHADNEVMCCHGTTALAAWRWPLVLAA